MEVSADVRKHSLGFVLDGLVGKTQNREAPATKIGVAFVVDAVTLLLVMDFAITFHN
jgi:hypothetical protein